MKSGIYTMSAAEYHADPCPQPSLSASIAHILCTQSPAHARAAHPKLNPSAIQEEATHFDIGTIAHGLILQGENLAEVIDAPDYRTKVAKEARDRARENGRVPVLAKHWVAVQEMIRATSDQLAKHSSLFEMPGAPEQTITWTEPTGVYCRARLDWLPESLGTICDYKTSSATVNPDILKRTMVTNGWDIQAAFYIRAVQMLYPASNPRFVFVCQETFEPYAMSFISPGADVMFLAEKKIHYAIEKWAECLQSGNWPGYPSTICLAELPAWHEAQWLERETR